MIVHDNRLLGDHMHCVSKLALTGNGVLVIGISCMHLIPKHSAWLGMLDVAVSATRE